MNLRLKAAAAPAVVALFLTACGPGDAEEAEREWVGTVTTEGDTTIVVNESGSVWGGTAALVEEASIGVEAGEDPYMLGEVRSIAAIDDRIYVLDRQVPALRAYDGDGNWLRDIGREGQGPGEFQSPTGVGVDDQGRVWVHEQVITRLTVFSPEGETLVTHNLGGARISGAVSSMTVMSDGRAYVFDIVRPDEPTADNDSRRIMKPYDIDGNAGEPVEMPQFDNPAYVEARTENAVRFAVVPFHPNGLAEFTPNGAVVTGHPDAYRFEVRHPDGTRTVIERHWDPVPVLPDEAAAHQRAVIRYMRDMDPDWNWNAAAIPAIKPAYSDFVPAESGEIWVVRAGPGAAIPDCNEDEFEPDSEPPCWQEQRIVDIFGADGRYLGELDVPPGFSMQPLPVIRGDDVIARVEDDAGTIMVKRYRLVPPGEPQ